MQQHFVKVLAAVVAMSAVGTTVNAQAPRPFRLGISAGASVPVGNQSDGTNTGYTVTANIGMHAVGTPFTVQFEVGWNQWGIKDEDGDLSAFSATGNLVYDLPTTSEIKPYVIGTAGLYHLTVSSDDEFGTLSSSTNKFGLGIGGGIRLPLSGFDTYIEARYTHALDTDVSFVPITFGIRF